MDFLVYRYGSAAALAGHNVYLTGVREVSLPFTYPPFAALALWPLNLAGPRAGYLLWTFASVACLAAAIWWTQREIVLRTGTAPAGWLCRWPAFAPALVTLAGGLSIVGYQHLSFGQVNLALMALCLGDVVRRSSRWLPRGLLIGAAAAIKLTPLLFLAFFVVTRQWRLAGWSMAGFAGAGLLAWWALPDMSATFWLHALWKLPHEAGLGPLFSSAGNSSPQGGLAALGAPAALRTVVSLMAAVAGLWCARKVLRDKDLFTAAVVVGLTAPLVSPVSWVHHWVYLTPAVLLLYQAGRARIALVISVGLLFPGGPATGPWLLHHVPGSGPLAVVFREILPLLTVTAIAALTIRDQPSSRCSVATATAAARVSTPSLS